MTEPTALLLLLQEIFSHKGCEIQKKTGKCVMPTEGIFAIVLEEGRIQKGDSISIEA